MTRRNGKLNVNPSAAVLIYNYRDRLGSNSLNANEQVIDQIILNTVSLKSISTNKSKSQPAGTFEIELAPTKNWVTAITPGSWCVILMGRTPIESNETKYFDPKVKQEHFKMLGRIDSVRAVIAVNTQTGAITTKYVVTGMDWGQIFNTYLYVDPASRTNEDTAVGAAERLLYDNVVKNYGESATQVDKYNSTNAMRAILSFWGSEDAASSELSTATDGKVLAKAINRFAVPDELSRYMSFTNKLDDSTPAKSIAEIVRTRTGKLKDYDKYTGNDNGDEEFTDGVGYIEPRSVFGTNTIWQLLTDNCNRPLNELIAEIRFENGKLLPTLYKRVKPFKVNTIDNMSKDAIQTNDSVGIVEKARVFLEKMSSDYKHIKRHKIDKKDILAINAGTNWQDRYNFVEINFGRQMIKNESSRNAIESGLKKDLQFFDHESIRRDGLIPMNMNLNYIPPANDGKGTDFENAFAYKYLAKEWYFDTHKMLNGVLTIVGQDEYIAVGENILIPSDVVAHNYNHNEQTLISRDKSFLLAHIESVSHNVSVDENGTRTFITNIQFVRGIITDSNGEALSATKDQTLDQDTQPLGPEKEVNDNVFGRSSGRDGKQDPDDQKLKGK